jgi:hypothetical protein
VGVRFRLCHFLTAEGPGLVGGLCVLRKYDNVWQSLIECV